MSSFLAHDILHLPHQGLLQRYTKIFISFLVSGVMHARVDTGGGISMRNSGAVQFFSMQALGIILEDSVQAIYTRFFKGSSGSNVTLLQRAAGHIWVLLAQIVIIGAVAAVFGFLVVKGLGKRAGRSSRRFFRVDS